MSNTRCHEMPRRKKYARSAGRGLRNDQRQDFRGSFPSLSQFEKEGFRAAGDTRDESKTRASGTVPHVSSACFIAVIHPIVELHHTTCRVREYHRNRNSTMAARLLLPRTVQFPRAIASTGIAARSFQTSALRRAEVNVAPVRRPVGAFRGG